MKDHPSLRSTDNDNNKLYIKIINDSCVIVMIQVYLNQTQNQSRNKLHMEHPLTTRTLEGVLVGVI